MYFCNRETGCQVSKPPTNTLSFKQYNAATISKNTKETSSATNTNRQTQMGKEYLVISTSIDLLRVASDEIVFISSDGNYSSFVFTYGESRVVTIQLGQLEKIIFDQLRTEGQNFVRIGKSLIINKEYIHYINISKQQLVLSDGKMTMHTLSASKEALKQLKELIEKEVK